ncbi:MAG: component of SufBCD complex, partial [Pseudoruegeria sp.]
MRSFSNLWYWIVLAVLWSTVSHWVLGVPFDLVQRAAQNPQAESDLETLVGINIRRLLYIDDRAGILLWALAFFVLTLLAITGFIYHFEFSQAVGFLAFPLCIVAIMSALTARRIDEQSLSGEDLRKQLKRLRFYIQCLGMAAIFTTSIFGMF